MINLCCPCVALDLDAAADLSALEVISDEEAVGIAIPSSIPPLSTSLKDYVDHSETLTKLVQLGNCKTATRNNV